MGRVSVTDSKSVKKEVPFLFAIALVAGKDTSTVSQGILSQLLLLILLYHWTGKYL